MVIERNIIKKVGEYNNIAICDERTVRIELTEAEIEEAYRIREREYLEEDIKNAVEEFCDYWGIPKGIAGGLNDNQDIICKIASLYEKNQDTNVASADTMKEAATSICPERSLLSSSEVKFSSRKSGILGVATVIALMSSGRR